MIPHLSSVGTAAGAESAAALGIQTKSNASDFATQVDVANEELITRAISSAFPSHRIIGEETVGSGPLPPLVRRDADGPDAPSHVWIVDPVDGTTNFAAGIPLTCVSVGMVDGRTLVPAMGVAYSPATDECYVAVRGRGAYRNGIKIAAPGDVTLSGAVVCFEYGYDKDPASIRKMTGAVGSVLCHGCKSVRSLGSGVLDLCYVAAGRLDVVFTGIGNEGWKPWDYCAAMVIVEEAGGTLRSLYGAPGRPSAADEFDAEGRVVPGSYVFDIYSRSMICGVNDTVVEECRNVILQGAN